MEAQGKEPEPGSYRDFPFRYCPCRDFPYRYCLCRANPYPSCPWLHTCPPSLCRSFLCRQIPYPRSLSNRGGHSRSRTVCGHHLRRRCWRGSWPKDRTCRPILCHPSLCRPILCCPILCRWTSFGISLRILYHENPFRRWTSFGTCRLSLCHPRLCHPSLCRRYRGEPASYTMTGTLGCPVPKWARRRSPLWRSTNRKWGQPRLGKRSAGRGNPAPAVPAKPSFAAGRKRVSVESTNRGRKIFSPSAPVLGSGMKTGAGSSGTPTVDSLARTATQIKGTAIVHPTRYFEMGSKFVRNFPRHAKSFVLTLRSETCPARSFVVPMTDEIVALTMVSGQYPRSDGVLLAEFRTGGEDAARRLYERYAGRLRRLAESYCKNQYTSRFDAEDVVQSVFRVFFQGVRGHGYDASSDGELWGLLSVIALNKVRGNIDHHSAAKRSVERTCSLPDALLPEMSSDESAAVFLKMSWMSNWSDAQKNNARSCAGESKGTRSGRSPASPSVPPGRSNVFSSSFASNSSNPIDGSSVDSLAPEHTAGNCGQLFAHRRELRSFLNLSR